MRPILMFFALLAVAAAATAQSLGARPGDAPGTAPGATERLEGRQNQKIERIRHEDAGSRIDEVRVGGQTQSITVQPKVEGLPPYDIQPASVIRDSAGGQRSWNVLRF